MHFQARHIKYRPLLPSNRNIKPLLRDLQLFQRELTHLRINWLEILVTPRRLRPGDLLHLVDYHTVVDATDLVNENVVAVIKSLMLIRFINLAMLSNIFKIIYFYSYRSLLLVSLTLQLSGGVFIFVGEKCSELVVSWRQLRSLIYLLHVLLVRQIYHSFNV